MSIDLNKLAAQGRAFSGIRPWTPEELEAVIRLETERGISRLKAADYVRNGILTLEKFDEAVEAEFTPKTLEEASVDVEAVLKDNEFAVSSEEAAKAAEKAAKKAEKEAAKAAKGAAKAAEAEEEGQSNEE